MGYELLSPQELRVLELARPVLEAFKDRCQQASHDANTHDAFNLGAVGESADVAGDALFNFLNNAHAYLHSEAAEKVVDGWLSTPADVLEAEVDKCVLLASEVAR